MKSMKEAKSFNQLRQLVDEPKVETGELKVL